MEISPPDQTSVSHGSPENATVARGLRIHERHERHLMTKLLHIALRPFKPSLTRPKKVAPEVARLKAPKKTQKLCTVTEVEIDGVWIYDLALKKPLETQCLSNGQRRRRIVYFAGGSWQMLPATQHWAFCTELVRRLDGTRVTIVSCPLAPKNPVSVAFPRIENTYKKILAESTEEGENVIVAGDSSGGNIALCVVLWSLKHQEHETTKPPVALLVISPTTDLRHELETIKQVDKFDPLHTSECINDTAKTWCPGSVDMPTSDGAESKAQGVEWSFEDPRVSPIQADLSYLVQHGVSVHGLTGSYDVLEPEAVVFRDKCKENGVTGEWLSWNGQMHCFPLAFKYGLKESKEAMDWIVHVLEQH
ncbi:esterase [Colletotrichum truncatum]|uniref:Esterase n=1 Tax=Colletotrichum truncatum TaxID=5467 RepID=A0ACC3ZH24_COLTU|nr:esterase [Colletotrichum truncatum]KAF6790596.1 esterase [Colletotrichum truncatum]